MRRYGCDLRWSCHSRTPQHFEISRVAATACIQNTPCEKTNLCTEAVHNMSSSTRVCEGTCQRAKGLSEATGPSSQILLFPTLHTLTLESVLYVQLGLQIAGVSYRRWWSCHSRTPQHFDISRVAATACIQNTPCEKINLCTEAVHNMS